MTSSVYEDDVKLEVTDVTPGLQQVYASILPDVHTGSLFIVLVSLDVLLVIRRIGKL